MTDRNATSDPRTFTSSHVALVAIVAAGCVGDIGGDGPTGPESVTEGDPGNVTIHRLNRAEYNNTVRDLLGTSLRPADDFPTDDHAHGFDNIADALNLSPVQFELYERAAENLVLDALAPTVSAATARVEAENATGSAGSAQGDAWALTSAGEVTTTHAFPSGGQYVVRARVWQDAAGAEAAQMNLTVGPTVLGPFDVGASSSSPMIVEQELTVAAGSHPVAVSFLNDYYDPGAGEDRNLWVDWIEIEGPIGATGGSPLRDRIVTCDFEVEGEPCLRQIVGDFAERAWRRPLEDAEIDGLMGVAALAASQGEGLERGLELALRATLTSPHFIFRVEIDPDPTSEVPHALGEFELASRLSYFLWSSMPDDELFGLAHAGALSDPATLEAQVERMLDDPKSFALVENFAGQWLFTRALTEHEPNYAAYPDFDEPLRAAMRLEADMFFDEFLKNGELGLDQLLVADFTYVNDRLAQHYGFPGTFGPEASRVALPDGQRGGILKHGAWLTVTSNPDRTSPVKRGKWVLENLLCSEPPPPPAGVEGFKPEDVEAKTQRELLAQHRSDPVCNSCHETMDNIGLGFENYDGIGAYRTEDKNVTIDASGVLEGQAFANSEELVKVIAADPRFVQCSVEKMFVYALGRAPLSSDREYFQQMGADFAESGMKLRQLVKIVVLSEPFRFRRGEKAKGGAQ